MSKLMVAAMLAAAASAADASEQDAYAGVAADAVSTGAALSAPGVSDANPFGWATVPLRLALVQHARGLPREEAQPVLDATKATGWGAAANNVLVLAGAGSAAPLVGAIVALVIWKSGETEREFWRICGSFRKSAPATRCRYVAWRSEEVVHVAGVAEPR